VPSSTTAVIELITDGLTALTWFLDRALANTSSDARLSGRDSVVEGLVGGKDAGALSVESRIHGLGVAWDPEAVTGESSASWAFRMYAGNAMPVLVFEGTLLVWL
jgi:hypothetical protein